MRKIKINYVTFTPEEMAYDAPAEIDFSQGVVIHGRAAWRQYLSRKRDFARLAPDVRKAFPDDHSVNEALRSLLRTRPRNERHRKSA